MILAKLGELSTAQDLVAGAAVSENVIKDSAVLGHGMENVWWVVDTETVNDGNGGSSSTYTFSLRVATTTALTTYKEILSVTITGATDKRLLTLGRHLAYANIGAILSQTIRDFRSEQSLTDSDDVYIGLMSTLADGNGDANISINAALSPTKPPTADRTIKVESPVGVPSKASAGS